MKWVILIIHQVVSGMTLGAKQSQCLKQWESQLNLVTMKVRQDMVNGHAICHGGMLFTLADTAFAYACNSYNLNTVASACHIDFLAPAHLNDSLVAVAVERAQSGRSGVYDVSVTTAEGKIVALFRGKSARIQGEVIASFAQD
jgi:acyl-CoA thioesterase